MAKARKPHIDRLLTEYGDAISNMVSQVKNGAEVVKLPPADMIDGNCEEALLRLVLDKAGEEDAAAVRARRIKNDILIAGKHAFYDSGEDDFRRRAAVYYVEKFEEAFASIERGDVNVSAALDAVQAAFAIATLTTPKPSIRKRVKREAGKWAGNKDRPGAKSPFHSFIDECLAKNPRATATDIERAFEADEDALDARFEKQGASFVTLEKPVRKMLISSFPAAISKRRKKI